ncbi:hypothetical protein RLIN73S_06790 [Rhodanobacter lindaniclasticus]
MRAPTRAHAHPGFRIGHAVGHLVDQMLQRMAAADAEKAAPVGVRIDIEHGLGLQLFRVCLGPFGGTEQARLLAIPAGVDQGAPRPPALLEQAADGLGLGHQGYVAGQWVPRAEDPAVVVIAADDPLVRRAGALDLRDHVVDRLSAPVRQHSQVRLGLARSDVVGQRQGAAPGGGRHRSAQRLQQRRGVGPGNRQHRDLQQRFRVLDRQPLGTGGGTDAGRERVARILLHVGHRAALHAFGGAPAAVGPGVALGVAVLVRVGIDQAADRAVLLRQLRLQPAPAAAVAGDHDLAAHVDAATRQFLVVVRHAVVGVDQRRGDIAVATVDVVWRQRTGQCRRGIAGDRRLVQGGGERLRPEQFQRHLLRRRIQHLEGLDVRIPAPGAELLQHELGIRLVVRRAHLVRRRRHPLQPVAQLGRVELGVEASFQVELGGGMRAGEAEQAGLRWGGGFRPDGGEGRKRTRRGKQYAHSVMSHGVSSPDRRRVAPRRREPAWPRARQWLPGAGSAVAAGCGP